MDFSKQRLVLVSHQRAMVAIVGMGILASKNLLHNIIDERELYWLADTDGIYSVVARVRPSGRGAPVAYPGLELLLSSSGISSRTYEIDVYRTATKGVAVGHVRAMAILAHHGEAAALLVDDKELSRAATWGILRENRVISRVR